MNERNISECQNLRNKIVQYTVHFIYL